MSYQKEWLPLAEALARAIEPAQNAKTDATKSEICQLVADRRIRVRVVSAGRVFEGLNVYVPKHLGPADFDWQHSRPRAPWFVGPGVSWKRDRDEWSEAPRTISLIELRRDQLDRLTPAVEATSALAATAGGIAYKTGAAGRPTSWHLVETELRRRHSAGEWSAPQPGQGRILAVAREMCEWLGQHYPSAPPLREKTLRNKLSPLLRELGQQSMSGNARNPHPK